MVLAMLLMLAKPSHFSWLKQTHNSRSTALFQNTVKHCTVQVTQYKITQSLQFLLLWGISSAQILTIDESAAVAWHKGVATVTLSTHLTAATSVASRTGSASDLPITLPDAGSAKPVEICSYHQFSYSTDLVESSSSCARIRRLGWLTEWLANWLTERLTSWTTDSVGEMMLAENYKLESQ